MTDKEKELQTEAIDYYRKRIAELEKENKTVSRKANEAIADKLLITAKYNEVLNDLNQENDKLQKENAELKEKLEIEQNARGDWFGKAVTKDRRLTEAKELLTKWVELFKPKGSNIPPTPIQVDTEQFLKEEVK